MSSTISRYGRIENLVSEGLRPLHLELENESSNHSVPVGSESHFKILIVSEAFEGLSRIDRQRKVYAFMDSEFKSGLHALTVRALTSSEWQSGAGVGFVSPTCQSKA